MEHIGLTPKLDIFDMKATATNRAAQLLVGQGQQYAFSPGQRHYRPHLVSITARICDSGNVHLASGRLIQPMIVNTALVTRAYVLKQPQEKLRTRENQNFVLAIPIVAICDCHFLSIICDNPLLGKRWTPTLVQNRFLDSILGNHPHAI